MYVGFSNQGLICLPSLFTDDTRLEQLEREKADLLALCQGVLHTCVCGIASNFNTEKKGEKESSVCRLL